MKLFDEEPENKEENAILIGAGSVGKKHALILSKLVKKLYVVDPDNQCLEWCKSNLECEVFPYKSLRDFFNHADSSLIGSSALIANWGVDHAKTFFELSNYGIKGVFLEKPFSHSIKNIDDIVDFSITNKINLVSGFQLRHSGLGDLIKSISKQFLGSEPTLMTVDGGANCIVTNGIHYLDLACSIFNSDPTEVNAQMKDYKINPRGKHLGFWEGFSSWKFPNDCQLSVVFSNQSSVSICCKVYGKNGFLIISNEGEFAKISTYRRSIEEIKNDPRITAYGPAKLDKTKTIKHNLKDTVKEMLLSLMNSKHIFNIDRESVATKAIIGALISSELNEAVNLPITKKHELYQKEWPVS